MAKILCLINNNLSMSLHEIQQMLDASDPSKKFVIASREMYVQGNTFLAVWLAGNPECSQLPDVEGEKLVKIGEPIYYLTQCSCFEPLIIAGYPNSHIRDCIVSSNCKCPNKEFHIPQRMLKDDGVRRASPIQKIKEDNE